MNWVELIQEAFKNTFTQGLRGYLTITGVIIGISAIVALVSLGQGLNTAVEKQFEMIGLNTIMVEPGSEENMFTTAFSKLREGDKKIIEGIPGVKKAIPFYQNSGIITKKNEYKNVFVIALEGNEAYYLEEMGYVNLEEGRNLMQNDRYSIILYKEFAENAFETPLLLREKIELEEKKFRIIGISKTSQLMGGGMISNMVLISKKAFNELFENEPPTEIAVLVTSKEMVEPVSREIEKRLEKDHGEKDFYVLSTGQMMESAGIILGIIQLFLIAIAAISLLVGGIGIMNTMIMNVIERTKEIGLMKAIGATNNQVLTLHLAEAGAIGGIGGTIGILIGIAVARGISELAQANGVDLTISVSFELMAGVLLFAILVGISSGFLPAKRASELDPVDALRYE
jgi:putative ABC transport system permease protein